MKKDFLFGKTLEELKEIVSSNALPAYTAKQIADWMYKKRVLSITDMTNLSKKAREILSAKYEIGRYGHENVQESVDGTKKYLFSTLTGNYIESAYIPEKERNTLCVSSQAGCKMGCRFCMTGKQGLQGNLSSGEILNQVYSLPEFEKLTNLVYMGMGEPFDNLEHVLKGLEIITSDYGLAWSPKRITVSTIGIIPGIKEYLNRSKCHLAISLHSPFEDERKKIMPIENVHSLPEILKTIKSFDFNRQQRISFEYIMFGGFNDTSRHVNQLARILNGIRCRINLIRFHAIPGSSLTGSDEETIQQFKAALNNKGIVTTIRASRGQDIFAACGLLSTKRSELAG